jgi:hypothetical protein
VGTIVLMSMGFVIIDKAHVGEMAIVTDVVLQAQIAAAMQGLKII